MKIYWEAEVLIYYQGVAHVLRELTPEAKTRIFSMIGRGKLRGPAYPDDFKRLQRDTIASTEKT